MASTFGASAILVVLLGATGARRPNIVFILADDLGYNELGFMNSSRGLLTPHIDNLARDGVALMNYYVQPICSPSRSALMTGRYPTRLGTQANVIYWDTPWGVPLEHKFLPQYLQDVGYRTAMFGKWHLGMFQEAYTPWKRGFASHVGYLQGCESAWTHVSACCGAQTASHDESYVCQTGGGKDYRGYDWFKEGVPDFSAEGTKSHELIRQEALRFLQSQAEMQMKTAPTSPFFLYLPFQNIHAPYSCEERYLALYKDDHNLTTAEQVIFGYISEMDAVVGDVVAELRSTGLYDDTVIIFSSDNGAPPARSVRGRNWPLRGHKGEIWDGGTRVPAIVSGALIPASRRGRESNELFHITDWLPTIASLAGAAPAPPLDGHDIWSSVVSGTIGPRSEMLYNINPLCTAGQAGPPKAGIRVGDWKLLAYCYSVAGTDGAHYTGPHPPPHGKFPADWPGLARNSAVVLFNLKEDGGEAVDIAEEYPDKVSELLGRLKYFAKEMVQPMQWAPPYQGDDYYCAKCPLRKATGPMIPWTPWVSNHSSQLYI